MGVSPAMPPKAAVTGAADAGCAGKAGGTPAPLKISAAFDNIFTRSLRERVPARFPLNSFGPEERRHASISLVFFSFAPAMTAFT